MPRRLLRLCAVFFCVAILPRPAVAEPFSLRGWDAIEDRAARNDARAAGLRDGYLAGVRDALRFYTKVANTFPICWPKDHEIDLTLLRNIVAAVRREFPDMAKPEDNFAFLVVLSLYNTYPCR
jgi:hypothetical protein